MQTKRIPLSNSDQIAVVDARDYEALSKHRWHLKNGYAASSLPDGGCLWMQNVIMGVDRGVDHIDRDPLNNRRSNLRVASKSLQGHNRMMPARSLPRGVSLHHGKYQASIRIDRKLHYLGRFYTPEEASAVYQAKALATHGEYAPE